MEACIAPIRGAPAVREIGDHLTERGVLLKEGSIVDVTIISVPSSTGNESNTRGPEMHRMKLRIGTDPRGLARHLEGTAANVATRRLRVSFCTAKRSGPDLTPGIAGPGSGLRRS